MYRSPAEHEEFFSDANERLFYQRLQKIDAKYRRNVFTLTLEDMKAIDEDLKEWYTIPEQIIFRHKMLGRARKPPSTLLEKLLKQLGRDKPNQSFVQFSQAPLKWSK